MFRIVLIPWLHECGIIFVHNYCLIELLSIEYATPVGTSAVDYTNRIHEICGIVFNVAIGQRIARIYIDVNQVRNTKLILFYTRHVQLMV